MRLVLRKIATDIVGETKKEKKTTKTNKHRLMVTRNGFHFERSRLDKHIYNNMHKYNVIVCFVNWKC